MATDVPATRPGIEYFNVGGKVFATSCTTLYARGSNFFTRLLDNDYNSKVPALRDGKGRIFIDRSPERFTSVLEYLRTGYLEDTTPTMMREFDFYAINLFGEPSGEDVIMREMHLCWRNEARDFVRDNSEEIEELILHEIRKGNSAIRLVARHDSKYPSKFLFYVLDSKYSLLISKKLLTTSLGRQALESEIQRRWPALKRVYAHNGKGVASNWVQLELTAKDGESDWETGLRDGLEERPKNGRT